MNEIDLIQAFLERYQHPIKQLLQRPPMVDKASKKRKISEIKTIYSLNELSGLVEEVKHEPNDLSASESEHGLSVRYLVTTDKVCLLAREGAPSLFTPRHGEMANNCFAAGNLFIEPNTKNILAINHQSGDFKPSYASLVFILKILLNAENINLSPQLYLIINEFNQGNVEVNVNLHNELRAMIANIPDPEVENVNDGYLTP